MTLWILAVPIEQGLRSGVQRAWYHLRTGRHVENVPPHSVSGSNAPAGHRSMLPIGSEDFATLRRHDIPPGCRAYTLTYKTHAAIGHADHDTGRMT